MSDQAQTYVSEEGKLKAALDIVLHGPWYVSCDADKEKVSALICAASDFLINQFKVT